MLKYFLNGKGTVRSIFNFLMYNFVFTLLISILYISTIFQSISSNNILYLIVAEISNFLMLYSLIFILLSLINLYRNKYNFIISNTTVLTLFNLLIFVDASIFRLYKFHINGMVINLITTDGAFDSVHFGFWTILTVIIIISIIITIEVFLANWVYKKYIQNSPSKLSKFYKLSVLFTILGIVLIDKGIYAVSDLHNNFELLRFSKVFPLYQPLTIKSLMEKKFGYKVDKADLIKIDNRNSTLNYPIGKIDSNLTKKYNILWIVLDSWRYDMLDSNITPNIYEFSKESLRLTSHYSGGNATRFGIYSMFYGLSGTYWHQFLAERRSPVMMDILQKNGYDFFIASSTRLTYPEFRKTAFINIPEKIHDNFNGDCAAKKDPQINEHFFQFMNSKKKNQPYFAFLFYDGPHGPYSYPSSMGKFQPSNTSVNYVTMGKNEIYTLKNSYKNGIYFDDYLVGKVIEYLKAIKQLENTIVLITGDHGEEFQESGFSGHCSAFTKEQTNVACVLHMPGQKKGNINYQTSHLDLVPTILNYCGNKTPYDRCSQGQNLIENNGRNYVMSSGWDNAAIITPNYTFVFSTETYNAAHFEIRDKKYQQKYEYKPILSQYSSVIKEFMTGMARFKK